MADLFDDYHVAGWDELLEAPGVPRAACRQLFESLQTMTADDFASRCQARDRSFAAQGITFSLSGEERPFPLDLVPRIIDAADWAVIEQGVIQRVRALEAFLADIYGPAEVFAEGIVPRRLVTTSSHFHRAAAGITPANGVRVHVAGIDLVRDPGGQFRVLEDNLRTPSGISYVVENRQMTAEVLPWLLESHRVRPVSEYPGRLLGALRAAAPQGRDDPTVVVLTPGRHNSAYFEHTFLAREMGVDLVEGRDLVCRDNVVYMRTTTGERRVDVVYRRVDDDFLDPMHFRPDSVVGCPGILNAARSGNVTVANAVGNGVADDKLLYTYVPDLVRYYLGEEPVLPNVDTYRLEDPDLRAEVVDRLDELVLKPVDGSGGYGLLIGPQASDEELARVRAAVLAQPRQWIAQEVVQLSSAPTHVGDRLRPRHLDLRPFAVNDGSSVWVVPGGLTRVALPEGSLVVNSSQGGGSKDTWVLAADDEPPVETPAIEVRGRSFAVPVAVSGVAPDPGPAAETQQQQQQ